MNRPPPSPALSPLPPACLADSLAPPTVRPLASVRLARVTTNEAAGGPVGAPDSPGLMKKMRDVLLPLISNWLAPGPLIVRFLSITNSPLVNVIVQGQPLRLNVMVSPALASIIAWRREPGPLSAVVVTESVVA